MSTLRVRDMYMYYLLDGNFVDVDSLGDLDKEYYFSKLDTGFDSDIRIRTYSTISILEVLSESGDVKNVLYLTRLTESEIIHIIEDIFGQMKK